MDEYCNPMTIELLPYRVPTGSAGRRLVQEIEQGIIAWAGEVSLGKFL